MKANLNADAGWDKAFAGADYVLHVASPLPLTNPQSDDELIRPARDGAIRVLRASRDAGIKRVVQTSSTFAITYGRGGRQKAFTETDWTDETNRQDTAAYHRSKTIAERAVWAWHAAEGGALELTTVNPGVILGPVLGPDFSTSILLIKRLLDGSMPALPHFGFNLVDVRDNANLHLLAMTSPKAAGQRFIGSCGFYWMDDIAKVLKQGLGVNARKIPSLVLPDFLVRLYANSDAELQEVLFDLGQRRRASSEKARRELGWTTRPVEQTILDTARSLLAAGLV